MVGQVIGGLTGIASGIIGSGKRKREQAAAQKTLIKEKLSMKSLILVMSMLTWRIQWKT